MLKKIIFVCFLTIGLEGMVWGQSEAVQKLLSASALQHAAVGISVKSLKDGRTLVAYHEKMALQPASVCKLLSTLLALEKKGPDFCYRTEVWRTGELENGVLSGDVVIKAAGDPCLDSRYFPDYSLLKQLEEKIINAGIKEITGRIIVQRNNGEAEIPGSWIWEDISNYYAACYQEFNYRDNTYVLDFQTGAAGNLAGLKSVTPEVPGIHFRNEVQASSETVDNAWIYGGPYARELWVKGTLPQQRSSFKVKGAMPDPVACFVAEMKKILGNQGVPVKETGDMSTGEQLKWFTLVSPPLKEIVRFTNKRSINLFAEALGKLVADGDYQKAVQEQLRRIGVNAVGITLKDPSGLSVFNAVSAEVFTDLLLWAYPNAGEVFVSSLPLAGKDAGLNGYCRNYTALRNNLRAKTGSMFGVRGLSGYLTTISGEILAFTILVNHFDGSSAGLQQEIGRFLERLRCSDGL